MRPDLVRRLDAVERRFGRDHPAAISDQELLAALNDRIMGKRELNALYQHIREPFEQTMIVAATDLRRDPEGRAREERSPRGPLEQAAFLLSYDSDDEVPGAAHWASTEPRPLPGRDQGHPIMEGLWVRLWMGHLLFQRRGKDELRGIVSQLADRAASLPVTTLGTAEATRMLGFLRPLEVNFRKLDMPFLIWADGEGHFFTSRESRGVDRDGQWWTTLPWSGATS